MGCDKSGGKGNNAAKALTDVARAIAIFDLFLADGPARPWEAQRTNC